MGAIDIKRQAPNVFKMIGTSTASVTRRPSLCVVYLSYFLFSRSLKLTCAVPLFFFAVVSFEFCFVSVVMLCRSFRFFFCFVLTGACFLVFSKPLRGCRLTYLIFLLSFVQRDFFGRRKWFQNGTTNDSNGRNGETLSFLFLQRPVMALPLN